MEVKKYPVDDLSDREIEILKFVATGASNKEIAKALSISTNTVKVHVRNIFGKIKVFTRTEAAMYAVKSGILLGETISVETSSNENISTGSGALPVITEKVVRSRNRSLILIFSVISISIVLGVLIFLLVNQRKFISADTGTLSLDPNPSWIQQESMNENRAAFAVAFVENQLFAFGGETETGITKVSEKFSFAESSWAAIREKPTAVKNINAVSVNGRIYIPGGEDENGEILSIVEVYNPETDQWTTTSPIPSPRSDYSLVTSEGKIYLIGGWDGLKFTNTVFRFDPDTILWDELKSMKTALGCASAVNVGSEIYIIGGKNESGVLDEIQAFSVPGDTNPEGNWKKVGSLPQPRHSMGSAYLADTILIIGGTNQDDKQMQNLAYNPVNKSWDDFNSPGNGSLTDPGVASSNTHIFLLGGFEEGKLVNSFYSFQVIYSILLPIVD